MCSVLDHYASNKVTIAIEPIVCVYKSSPDLKLFIQYIVHPYTAGSCTVHTIPVYKCSACTFNQGVVMEQQLPDSTVEYTCSEMPLISLRYALHSLIIPVSCSINNSLIRALIKVIGVTKRTVCPLFCLSLVYCSMNWKLLTFWRLLACFTVTDSQYTWKYNTNSRGKVAPLLKKFWMVLQYCLPQKCWTGTKLELKYYLAVFIYTNFDFG